MATQASSLEVATVVMTTVLETRRMQALLVKQSLKRSQVRKKKRRSKKKRRRKNNPNLPLDRELQPLLLVGLDSQSLERHQSRCVPLQAVLAASPSEQRKEKTTAANELTNSVTCALMSVLS